MKLYCFPPSPNTRKVLTVAYHLGMAPETQIVNLPAGEQRTPDYRQINPNGMTPTLRDGDFVIWESNAIMQYLASKKPNSLWPDDARSRADISRWQFWDVAHWAPACSALMYEKLIKKRLGIGEPDAAAVKQGEEKFHRFAPVLDDHLQRRDYLVGNDVTLADISVACYLMYAEQCQLPIENYTNLQNWFARIEKLDAWRKAAPPPMS